MTNTNKIAAIAIAAFTAFASAQAQDFSAEFDALSKATATKIENANTKTMAFFIKAQMSENEMFANAPGETKIDNAQRFDFASISNATASKIENANAKAIDAMIARHMDDAANTLVLASND